MVPVADARADTWGIYAHLGKIYGAEVSEVANRPVHIAIGVTVDGTREIVGRRRRGGDQVLASRPDRDQEPGHQRRVHPGLRRADGHPCLPDAVASVWACVQTQTIVQACVVHLLRNSFRYASRKDWRVIAKNLKPQAPIYTSATEAAALDRFAFAEFSEHWEARYPAIMPSCTCGSRLGPSSSRSCPSPTTSGRSYIRLYDERDRERERVNALIRNAVKARGHFPNEQAALKCVYLAVRL